MHTGPKTEGPVCTTAHVMLVFFHVTQRACGLRCEGTGSDDKCADPNASTSLITMDQSLAGKDTLTKRLRSYHQSRPGILPEPQTSQVLVAEVKFVRVGYVSSFGKPKGPARLVIPATNHYKHATSSPKSEGAKPAPLHTRKQRSAEPQAPIMDTECPDLPVYTQA